MKKNHNLLLIFMIMITIVIANRGKVLAGNDIASGVYDGVPWKVTNNYELIIGETGKTYTIESRGYRGEESWPWENHSNLFNSNKIISAKVVGKVYGTGSLDHMFNLPGCRTIDIDNLDTHAVTGMESMFWCCQELEELDLSSFDTGEVASMESMFETCDRLRTINLSTLDTSNVRSMVRMFCGCDSLQNINLASFNTSNVKTMNSMFSGCGLTEIDISSFDTSNVTNMRAMFYRCKSLKGIDFKRFNTDNSEDMAYMFSGCESLTSLDLSSFDTKKVHNMEGMFLNCKTLSSLNISSFDTREVRNMEGMFGNDTMLSAISLANINMSKVGWDYDEEEGSVIVSYLGKKLLRGTKPQIIDTPIFVRDIIELPYVMYDQQGNMYSSLPMNLDYSIKLYKDKQTNGNNSQAYVTRSYNSLFGVKLVKVSRGNKSFTAKWEKASKKQQKQFSGYQVQYSTVPDFTTGVKTKSITKKKASKIVIRKLKKKTTYYIRMRRFKKSGNSMVFSDWSNIKQTKTK